MPQETLTPLEHIVKVLALGTPSEYRDHTYINGESMYFPTGRVYGGQVIAPPPACRIPSTAISSLPAISARICCSTWRSCATAARSPRAE